jgi:hypothetical protein
MIILEILGSLIVALVIGLGVKYAVEWLIKIKSIDRRIDDLDHELDDIENRRNRS